MTTLGVMMEFKDYDGGFWQCAKCGTKTQSADLAAVHVCAYEKGYNEGRDAEYISWSKGIEKIIKEAEKRVAIMLINDISHLLDGEDCLVEIQKMGKENDWRTTNKTTIEYMLCHLKEKYGVE